MIRHLKVRFLVHTGEIAQVIAAQLFVIAKRQRGLRPARAVNDDVRAMRVPFVDERLDDGVFACLSLQDRHQPVQQRLVR
ncbi:hypothetical protein D3C85_1681060 [compost metagenome]